MLSPRFILQLTLPMALAHIFFLSFLRVTHICNSFFSIVARSMLFNITARSPKSMVDSVNIHGLLVVSPVSHQQVVEQFVQVIVVFLLPFLIEQSTIEWCREFKKREQQWKDKRRTSSQPVLWQLATRTPTNQWENERGDLIKKPNIHGAKYKTNYYIGGQLEWPKLTRQNHISNTWLNY